MKAKIQILVITMVAIVATGCVTQKRLTYLQDAHAGMQDSINAQFDAQSQVIIRSGDALTIFVSALDQEAVTPYNIPVAVYAQPGSNDVRTTPMLQYYIVDAEGNVVMPVLGAVHLAGLTRTEAEAKLCAMLSAQVTNPTVQVNIINAKVSVLGEVNTPGLVPMRTDRLTLLEALAAAGDMTAYGRRDNILITREVNGKLELARINITSSDLYTSPFYYLQPNDVVYVSPNKVRAVSSVNAGLWISLVGTLASTASVVVTVVKK